MTKHSWDGKINAENDKLRSVLTRIGDMNRTMMALHERYGPLVRTGPNEVSVSDAAAIKTDISSRNQVPEVRLVLCVARTSEVRSLCRTK